MCMTCGCGGDGHRVETGGAKESRYRPLPPGSIAPLLHPHHHHAPGHHDQAHPHPQLGSLRATAAEGEQRLLRVERDVLEKNATLAAANRSYFTERGIFALNLVSSPGSGKTTLLCRTIEALRGKLPVAVIEGDQQTNFDAERVRATGAPAIQINTGKGCHLDAHMVGHALEHLPQLASSVLMIENVGNLVCPALFDLGEAHKVVVLSVTEGEDKPLKYPDMFAAANLMLVNKIDLLPYVEFDVEKAIAFARRVNPAIEHLSLSATRGDGMRAWLDWIERGASAAAKISTGANASAHAATIAGATA